MKKHLFHLIANNRKNLFIKKLSNSCWSIIKAYENWNNNHYTNGEFSVIKKLSSFSIKIVFDAGANVGAWSAFAASAFQEAKVFSFEPIPEIFNQLDKNCRSESRIHPICAGLSDENKAIDFYYYPQGKLFNSMFNNTIEGEKQLVNCKVMRGVDFCNEQNIDHIDFLKIDVEGAEHLVLQGFEPLLATGRIHVIQFEYGRNNIHSKFLLRDFYQLLESNGYLLGKIYPNYVDFSTYKFSMENFMESNFLAVHQKQINYIKVLGEYDK